MLYLLASFYNTKSDSLVGLRVINVFDDGNIGEFFDVTKEDMLELIQNDKAELYKVKNEDDLERWCRYTSMFDVETGNLINDMKYVKLNDTCYADSLGNVHKARNLAELDNFVSTPSAYVSPINTRCILAPTLPDNVEPRLAYSKTF